MIGETVNELIYFSTLRAKLRHGFKKCRLKREALVKALDELNFADLYHATKHDETIETKNRKRRRIPFVPPLDVERGRGKRCY